VQSGTVHNRRSTSRSHDQRSLFACATVGARCWPPFRVSILGSSSASTCLVWAGPVQVAAFQSSPEIRR
jgi:hypothetical protein